MLTFLAAAEYLTLYPYFRPELQVLYQIPSRETLQTYLQLSTVVDCYQLESLNLASSRPAWWYTTPLKDLHTFSLQTPFDNTFTCSRQCDRSGLTPLTVLDFIGRPYYGCTFSVNPLTPTTISMIVADAPSPAPF